MVGGKEEEKDSPVATSWSYPWWDRPPCPAYSPSEFSRTITLAATKTRRQERGSQLSSRRDEFPEMRLELTSRDLPP